MGKQLIKTLMVQLAKKCGADIPVCPSPESADRNVCATFPEEAAKKDLLFMDKVSDLLNVPQASSLPKSGSQGWQDACDTTLADIEAFIATTSLIASPPSASPHTPHPTSLPSSSRRGGCEYLSGQFKFP